MKQEDKFSRIVELMSAMTGSDLTQQQKSELESLLDTAQLRKMHDEVYDGKEIIRGFERYSRYPSDAAFNDFRQRILRGNRRRRLYRKLAIAGTAAAVLIFASIAGLRLMRQAVVEDSYVMPSAGYAMLITGADDRFELSARDTVITIFNSNVTISDSEIRFNMPDDGLPEENISVQNRIVVPRGRIYTAWLVDGTKVVLNSESELSFPSVFPDYERSVALRGEGYFEVAADARRPFTIHTDDNLNVRVLGTKFNVQAYGDIAETYVTLVEGSVSVRYGQADVILSPNDQAVFNRDSGLISVRHIADASNSTAWINGHFDFQAVTLDVIIKSLEKRYNVDIITTGFNVEQLGIFSVRMSHRGDIVQMLDLLRETAGLDYRIDGRNIYLFPKE